MITVCSYHCVMTATASSTAAPAWAATDLTSLADLSAGEITALLDRAQGFLPAVVETSREHRARVEPTLAGRIIANLFLEDSTRTRGSFTVAAQRLGGATLDMSGKGSSISKGETLLDTGLTVAAMGVDAIVMRTSVNEAPHVLADHVDMPVINAGDGNNEHPTQGLLDALTLRQRLGNDLAGKRIAIVGDIRNSRVAGSNIRCLPTLGLDVVLVGPESMCPGEPVEGSPHATGSITVTHDLDAVLSDVDAIMMLRVQFERGSDIGDDYADRYALTEARTATLPDHAPVLHPGPMNRGLEIADAVADDPKRSAIRQQVTNGVAVRMAVLDRLVGNTPCV